MRKFLTALVAVLAIGATTLAMSSPASAQWRGGWGWGPGPFLGGALLGGALAAGMAAPYYNYGPYYPYGPYYGYGCRRVWNGYYWVTACY
jgi:hypothetical protein